MDTEKTTDYVALTREFTLNNGKVYHLEELNFQDYADGEELIGRPQHEWFPLSPDGKARVDFKTMGILIWLMCRKHGITWQQAKAKEWAFELEECLFDWTQSDFVRCAEQVFHFFRASSEGQADSSSEPAASSGAATTKPAESASA